MEPGERASLVTESHTAAPAHHALNQGCEIWGVLNVTPDSFSDGGRFAQTRAAMEHAERLVREGANVIDVGGESSRPAGHTYGSGAGSVPLDVELSRVMPLVSAIRSKLGATVSIDTVKPEVARQAIEAGATIVNDVSCGASSALLEVVAQAGVDLVVMHTRGRGEVSATNARYGDVVSEVIAELMLAVERAVACGVRRERVWIDPGIGFAKNAMQSLQLVAHTAAFVATGQRVLVGPSRKSFIATVAPDHGGDAPKALQREGGTAAAVTIAVLGGAHAIRVHDVAPMRQAAMIARHARAVPVVS